jgi:trehalose 6-phosphate synthase
LQYISKYSASFWGQSFVGEMTKISAGEPTTLSAPAQKEAREADIPGRMELMNKDNLNGVSHSVVGKVFEQTKEAVNGAKEVVTGAKDAIAQGEPHVAFSSSS